MPKAQNDFFDQFALEDEDVKRDFLCSYAYALLDQHETEPLQRAIDLLNDEWELDPEATPELVKSWLEDTEAISLAKTKVQQEIRKDNALQKFREHREAGATFMASMKATGEDAAFMTHALEKANMFELSPERLKILRQARREEYQAKAFKARQKAYRMLSNKVEEAMKNADFSSLSADKLADIMLKLTQVTKEDEPPVMSIEIDWRKKI